MHFELVLGWILVFVVMESQDPDDWQLPLSQLPVDPDQPSTSRRRARDEAESSERCANHEQSQVFHNFHCQFYNWKIRLW